MYVCICSLWATFIMFLVITIDIDIIISIYVFLLPCISYVVFTNSNVKKICLCKCKILPCVSLILTYHRVIDQKEGASNNAYL